jgi:FtsH-binding integral membrane protein
MAFDPWTTPSARADRELSGAIGTRDTAATFMAKVYRWMAAGLGVTGAVAMMVASSDSILRMVVLNRPVFYGLMIGELLLVLLFSRVARTASFATAAAMFLVYTALNGVTFSVIFLIFARESIASSFFITGGAFGAMSVYGTITKKDLSSWGSFLMMGLIGIIIAGVVNIFVGSGAMSFIISCASVVVFTGLTAWDTQKIRTLGQYGDERMALTGALSLYLDFVNLFLALLNLLGRRR